MANEQAWVTVASTYFLPEADLIRSVLAEHDIDVFLKGEHTAGLASPLSMLDRGIRVQVPRRDETRALEILRQFETNGDHDEDEDLVTDVSPNPPPTIRGSQTMWAVITGAALLWLVLTFLFR